MKRKMILPITLLLAFTLITMASAAPTMLADVTIRSVSGNAVINNATLQATGSYLTPGPCKSTYTPYMKWSLSDVTTAAGATSTLTLHAYYVTSGSSGSIELHKVSDTTWTEASISADNPPAVGDLIASVSVPSTSGTVSLDIVFTGSALASYINQQSAYVNGGTDTSAGPNIMSLAVQITGCTGSSAVSFYSSTGSTQPALSVLAPTAVTMSTFQEADPAANWPLIAGLGALVALVAGGVLFYRKRATTH
jgi:hypothetical protein